MILYVDCSAGVSGDMLLAGLIHLGLPLENLRQILGQLELSQVRLKVDRIFRQGVEATRIRILFPEGRKKIPKTAKGMIDLIRGSSVSDSIKRPVVKALTTLARAEGKVHRCLWSDVQFHQLGRIDTLVDLVGFVAGRQSLGFNRVYCSEIPLGCSYRDPQGIVQERPGPLVRLLLRSFPTVLLPEKFEWTTPTGACLLASFGVPSAPPPFAIKRLGFSVGRGIPPSGSRVMRLLLGQPV